MGRFFRTVIDERLGIKRPVIGYQKAHGTSRGKGAAGMYANQIDNLAEGYEPVKDGWDVTGPGSPEAEEWDGWGSGLKPSQECSWLARKPLSEKTLVDNVLKWGTGVINIDASRIAHTTVENGNLAKNPHLRKNIKMGKNQNPSSYHMTNESTETGVNAKGRWPANVMFSHIMGDCCPDCNGEGFLGEGARPCATCKGYGEIGGCRKVGTKEVKKRGGFGDKSQGQRADAGEFLKGVGSFGASHYDQEGKEIVEKWECVPECAARQLDEQTGNLHASGNKADTGTGIDKSYSASSYHVSYLGRANRDQGGSSGASRFFYCPKAHTNERYFFCRTCGGIFPRKEVKAHRKLDHDIFQHPTQKPLRLMEYLVRMVTPPGGTVLDPFCGTGTTGVACRELGFEFLGIDTDPNAVKISRYRIEFAGEPIEPVQTSEPTSRKEIIPEDSMGILGFFMADGEG